MTSAPKKYIAYNSINQPTTITVGTSLTDTNPIAKDEFKYSPEGERYYKKSTYQQSGSLRTEHTFYVSGYEVIIFDAGATYQSEKSLIGNMLHVRKTPFAGAPAEFQYVLHRDHLGSTDAVTLDNGNLFTSLAFEPFGGRRNSATLTGNITSPQLNDLFLKMDALPSAGYTGHEALDRTGFIHMNGRVYDPQLARFLSPDPLVQAPTYSQSWNRYSYVFNNPLKYVDPTGYATETVCVTQHYEQEDVTTCTVTTTPDSFAAVAQMISSGVQAAVEFSGVVDIGNAAIDAYVAIDLEQYDELDNIAVAAGVNLVTKKAKMAEKLLPDKVKAVINKTLQKSLTGKGSVPPGQRDPKRVMTKNEKGDLLKERGGKCEGCGKDISVDDARGHHIERHADGGRTTPENTAILCDSCHIDIHRK